MIPFKEIKVTPSVSPSVYVSGSTAGIYMETDGVLIIDTGEILSEEGTTEEPAKDVVKPGDYIVAFDSQTIRSKKDLIEDIRNLNGESVELTPVKDMQGSYKLGIWVRDNTQGIGTITFVDENGSYGALGHGISDVDTGDLLKIEKGALYQAEILGIQKGSNGSPGELAGLIRYDSDRVIGTIQKNTENGIYDRNDKDDGCLQTGTGNRTGQDPMLCGWKCVRIRCGDREDRPQPRGYKQEFCDPCD